MPRTLVLVRHGQSEWNLKNLFTGWRDVGLSDFRERTDDRKLNGPESSLCSVVDLEAKLCRIVTCGQPATGDHVDAGGFTGDVRPGPGQRNAGALTDDLRRAGRGVIYRNLFSIVSPKSDTPEERATGSGADELVA